VKGIRLGITIRRWLLLSMAVAALWPGLIAYLDFFLDDRSAYEDDNELTALGLILSGMPFALLLMALGMLREARIVAVLMLPVVAIAILITSLPAWFDAYNLGLGASSNADVAYLEWHKIGGWIGLQALCTLTVICLDALLTPALQRAYDFGRSALARRI
jgi:uncharacterized membrane protein